MRLLTRLCLLHLLGAALVAGAFSAHAQVPEPAQTVSLWPGLNGQSMGEVLPDQGDATLRITKVENPTIAIYPAPFANGPVPAVLVCPGGGYKRLAWDKEGTEAAQWLNSIGLTAVVLKYRVPDNRTGALEDAQRAMGLMRHNAAAWKIDPAHTGILGFSAGAHLAVCLSTGDGTRVYRPIDEADAAPCAPDFTMLIYPAYLSDSNLHLPAEIKVSKDTPPAFIVQTQDDTSHIDSSLSYYIALKTAGVSAELHLFHEGGHGFGLRPSENAVSRWPVLCRLWLARFTGPAPTR